MALYLLDTDHLSYLQERHPRVLARLSLFRAGDRLFTSVVGVAELLKGIHLLPAGRRQRELLELYHQTLQRMAAILPISRSAAERFAAIDASLRRKGRPIPVNDVWVAAAALVEGAILVTGDAHFTHIDQLKTENWVAPE